MRFDLLGEVLSRDMAGSVYLKDCHWNMKPLPYSVHEVMLLPTFVVGAPQSDEDVIRVELTHSVLEGLHWCVRIDPPRTGCTQRIQMAEHGIQALVGLVCGTVDVRHEPLKRARQTGSDDKTVGSSFDQEPNKGRKRTGIYGSGSGRDKKSQFRQRSHETPPATPNSPRGEAASSRQATRPTSAGSPRAASPRPTFPRSHVGCLITVRSLVWVERLLPPVDGRSSGWVGHLAIAGDAPAYDVQQCLADLVGVGPRGSRANRSESPRARRRAGAIRYRGALG